MKTNPDDPINIIHSKNSYVEYYGLTKKEYFSALAMQALCQGLNASMRIEGICDLSIQFANELINQLNKNE